MRERFLITIHGHGADKEVRFQSTKESDFVRELHSSAAIFHPTVNLHVKRPTETDRQEASAGVVVFQLEGNDPFPPRGRGGAVSQRDLDPLRYSS